MATGKEEILNKAFSQGMSNAAIRHFDRDIDFTLIKTDMQEYCEKKGYEVSEEEIVDYIKEEMAKIREAMIDFSFNYKMMP